MNSSGLAASSAHLALAFERAPVAMFLLRGPEFIVELANAAAVRLCSAARGLLGSPAFEALSSLFPAQLRHVFARVLEGGRAETLQELKVMRACDGAAPEQRVMDFALEPLGDARDALLVIGSDVTERVELRESFERRARDAAERASARLHAQFMQAPVAVSVVTGPDFVYELANPRYEELVGRKVAIGRSLRDNFPELPEDADVLAVLRSVFETGQPFHAEEYRVDLVRSEGARPEPVYFKFTSQPVRDDRGDIRDIMTVALDVTENVQARKQKDALLERLKLADERKDEFLAMLAHELRNPMAALNTALAMFAQVEHDPVKTTHFRETAQRQMRNLVRLVDDLLDVARITRGKVELRKEATDVASVLNSAVAATRAAIDERGHTLRVLVEGGPFVCELDAMRVEQVVVNLLTNAVKYTDAGGTLLLQLKADSRNGQPHARISLHDSGRGIPAHMVEHVFDSFTQVNPSIDRRAGGLGLGLTLVKQLVEMHGGEVAAYSDGVGRGSEFVVTIPCTSLSTKPQAEVSTPWPKPGAVSEQRRVLIVEDSDDAREMLQEFIQMLGHEVITAADGLEGVERCVKLAPDIALVDIGLPGIDGYELARRVRAACDGKQPMLVALTGYGGPEVSEETKRAGFDMHVTKPIDVGALPELLKKAKPS